MEFYNDMEKSLLEAIAIEQNHIPLSEKKDMPAPTFFATDREKELIDEMIRIRKSQGISQKNLAHLTNNKQQAISRMEQKENSPSLKTFLNILFALGYNLQIAKY